MRWVLRLIATGDDARRLSTDLVEICRPKGLGDIENLGLTLPEARQLLTSVQRAVVSVQVDSLALQRPYCRSCRGMSVITLFDGVASAVFDGLPTSASRELYEAVTQFSLGPPRKWGSSGNRGWRGYVVRWVKLLSEVETGRAIADGATNLKQEVRAAS